MKRNLKTIWYRIGYVDQYGEQITLFVRYCKDPKKTREFKHLLKRLDYGEFNAIFTNAFIPSEPNKYEIPVKEYNY